MQRSLFILFLFCYTSNYAQKLELKHLIQLSQINDEGERDIFLNKFHFTFKGQTTYEGSLYAIQTYSSQNRTITISLFSIKNNNTYEHSFSVNYITRDLSEKQNMIIEAQKLGYKRLPDFMGKRFGKNKIIISMSTQASSDGEKPFKNYIIGVSNK